jgi:hypothetical protein
MLCRVLEDAWLSVGARSKASLAEKSGRLNLAEGISASAKSGQLNPEALKHYAVSRALSLLGTRGAEPAAALLTARCPTARILS